MCFYGGFMSNNIFGILEKIDIIDDSLETGESTIYSSFIESIGKESLSIFPPVREDITMQAQPGDVLRIRSTTEKCSYFFEAILLGHRWKEVALWEISLPLHIQRVQLRQHVRVKVILEVELEFISETLEHAVIQTFTKDVSAGGLQVVMPIPPPTDSKVMVLLFLENETTLTAKGEFTRIEYPKTECQKHFASIKFCDLDEKMTNKIVKYIFDKQIEQRQKNRTLFT